MNFDYYCDRGVDGASKWLQMADEEGLISPDSIALSIADMEFKPCSEITEALTDYVKNKVLGYTRPTKDYYESVVNFMSRIHNYKIKEEWIFTSPGIIPAMANLIRVFSDDRDSIVIFTPVYSPFYDIIIHQNRNLLECELQIIDNRYYINFDLLEQLLSKENTKILLLCSPHNPSGRVWSREELEKISDLCNKYNVIVISDEIHADLILGNNQHYMYGTIDKFKNNVICTSASKTFNIAGLQTSNIIIENEKLRTKFVNYMNSIGIERANILGLVATKTAYNKCDKYLKELLKFLETQHSIVEDFCEKHSDKLSLMKSESSFLSWINFEATGIAPKDFYKKLRDVKLFVNNGIGFGKSSEYFIRINLGLPERKLKEALNRLESII